MQIKVKIVSKIFPEGLRFSKSFQFFPDGVTMAVVSLA